MTDMRQAFEKWAQTQGLPLLQFTDCLYHYEATGDAWFVWQAAWAMCESQGMPKTGDVWSCEVGGETLGQGEFVGNLPGLYLDSGEFVPADKLQGETS